MPFGYRTLHSLTTKNKSLVIPAKAGIQCFSFL